MTRPRPLLLGLWIAAVILVLTGVSAARAADGVAGVTVPAEASGGASEALLGGPPRVELRAPQDARSIRVPTGSLDTPLLTRLRSLLGLVLLVGVAWGMSVDRSKVSWRVVGWGIGLQLAFAVFILKTPVGAEVFDGLGAMVVALLGFATAGGQFLFGNLVFDTVPVGTGVVGQGGFVAIPGQVAQVGASFAFNVLPTIIFFSALMTVLYHLGVMQVAVRGIAWVMQRTMGTSGAETLSAAGNIFVGQTEAPLLIKPFIDKMTMSELMAVMTGGFATVAGGVLAAYVGMLLAYFPDIAGHMIAASVMSAPAALVVAKLMYPEDGTPETAGSLDFVVEKSDVNVIDAAARGASEGLMLALNVGAMLLAFVALIQLCNGILGWAGGFVGWDGITLEAILGWLLAPLAWLMGVSWADAPTVASLLGVKTVLNEFVAYLQLASTLSGDNTLEPRSVIIATYALSGFANFASIAMQIGSLGGIAPARRRDVSRLGMRAMIGGSIAAFMTATVAGMIL